MAVVLVLIALQNGPIAIDRDALSVDVALVTAVEAGIRDPKRPLAERTEGYKGETKEATPKALDSISATSANGSWSIVVGRKK